MAIFNFDTNATDFIGMLKDINTFSDMGQGGIVGIVILLLTFAGAFLVSKAFSFEKSFGYAGFATAIIGMFLGAMGLINAFTFEVVLVLLVISLFFLWKERSNEEP